MHLNGSLTIHECPQGAVNMGFDLLSCVRIVIDAAPFPANVCPRAKPQIIPYMPPAFCALRGRTGLPVDLFKHVIQRYPSASVGVFWKWRSGNQGV